MPTKKPKRPGCMRATIMSQNLTTLATTSGVATKAFHAMNAMLGGGSIVRNSALDSKKAIFKVLG